MSATATNTREGKHTPGSSRKVWLVEQRSPTGTVIHRFHVHDEKDAAIYSAKDERFGYVVTPLVDAGAFDDMLTALKAALAFIEEEADNRGNAGSEYSDYEREPRDLSDLIAAVIAKAEARS